MVREDIFESMKHVTHHYLHHAALPLISDSSACSDCNLGLAINSGFHPLCHDFRTLETYIKQRTCNRYHDQYVEASYSLYALHLPSTSAKHCIVCLLHFLVFRRPRQQLDLLLESWKRQYLPRSPGTLAKRAVEAQRFISTSSLASNSI